MATEDPSFTPTEKRKAKEFLGNLPDEPDKIDIGQIAQQTGIKRRQALQVIAAVGVGSIAGGVSVSQLIEEAQAAASTSDSDGNVGTPSDRVDVFADGVDANVIDTGQAAIGDTAATGDADVAVVLDGSTARAFDAAGQIDQGTDHGSVIQSAINSAGLEGVVVLGPGTYSTSPDADPITTGDEQQEIEAYGAVIDSTFRVENKHCSVYGLTVAGAAGGGFEFYRSQEATYHALTAENCGGAGFRLGGEADAQVARAVFLQCMSDGNNRGYLLDGSDSNAFVNDNRLYGCDAKNCSNEGFLIESGANYNVLSGVLSESNNTSAGSAAIDIRADANTLVHPYATPSNAASDSIRFGSDSTHLLGGKLPGGINLAGGEWYGFVQANGSNLARANTTKIKELDELQTSGSITVASTTDGEDPSADGPKGFIKFSNSSGGERFIPYYT